MGRLITAITAPPILLLAFLLCRCSDVSVQLQIYRFFSISRWFLRFNFLIFNSGICIRSPPPPIQAKRAGGRERRRRRRKKNPASWPRKERKKKNSIREIPLADSPFLSFPHLWRHVSCHSARFSYSLPSQEEGYFAHCKSKGDLTVSAVKAPKVIPISSFARLHFVAVKKCAKNQLYQPMCFLCTQFIFATHTLRHLYPHTHFPFLFFSPPAEKIRRMIHSFFPLFRSIFRLWIKDVKRINHISMRKEVFSDSPLILCRFFSGGSNNLVDTAEKKWVPSPKLLPTEERREEKKIADVRW